MYKYPLCGIVLLIGGLTLAASRQLHAQPVSDPEWLLSWGKEGTDAGEFRVPIGIAVDPADHVFVTDLRNERVQRFDAAGRFLSLLGCPPAFAPADRAFSPSTAMVFSTRPTDAAAEFIASPPREKFYRPGARSRMSPAASAAGSRTCRGRPASASTGATGSG